MQIIRRESYKKNLQNLLEYIAKQDGYTRASDFLSKLNYSIKNLPNFPYKYRKSFYYESEYIRDCIFKGYTIPYLIDERKNQIVILDIFKWGKR